MTEMSKSGEFLMGEVLAQIKKREKNRQPVDYEVLDNVIEQINHASAAMGVDDEDRLKAIGEILYNFG